MRVVIETVRMQEAQERVNAEMARFRSAHLKNKFPMAHTAVQTRRLLKALRNAHAELERQFPGRVVSINVFGSRAKGYALPSSDVEYVLYLTPSSRALDDAGRIAHGVVERHLDAAGMKPDQHLSFIDYLPGQQYPQFSLARPDLLFRSIPITGKQAFLLGRLRTLKAMRKAGARNPYYRNEYASAVSSHDAWLLSTGGMHAKASERIIKQALRDDYAQLDEAQKRKLTAQVKLELAKLEQEKAKRFGMHTKIDDEIQRQEDHIRRRYKIKPE